MPTFCTRVLLGMTALALVLPGCSTGTSYFVAKDEPWRAKEELACLAAGAVRVSPFIKTRSALGGPSACGAERPFVMAAANGGSVSLKPPAILRCPMIPQVDRWVSQTIEPAARRYFRMPVVEIKVAGSYSCRPMNNKVGGNLSEHGHANALDVSGFVLADGRRITVKKGWRGTAAERGFLNAVHDGACATFTTVLGPNYDANHHDHFHVDLARRGRNGLGHTCK